jgi:hypothetical protein
MHRLAAVIGFKFQKGSMIVVMCEKFLEKHYAPHEQISFEKNKMEKAHQVLSKPRVISSSIILTIAELQASKHMNPTSLLVHRAVCCNQNDLGLEVL